MDETLELADDLVEKSNEEDGMIDYRATQDVRDETTVRFFRAVRGREGLRIPHHFREFEERLPDLLAGEPEVVRFEVADASELEL